MSEEPASFIMLQLRRSACLATSTGRRSMLSSVVSVVLRVGEYIHTFTLGGWETFWAALRS